MEIGDYSFLVVIFLILALMLFLDSFFCFPYYRIRALRISFFMDDFLQSLVNKIVCVISSEIFLFC